MYEHYGRMCNCCGEEEPLFLTIDHVTNDASDDIMKNGHRRAGRPLFVKIIRSAFPDTYQILCFNCNLGKNINKGTCPHIEEYNE